MDEAATNPGFRLYGLLDELRSASREDRRIREVLGQVFGLDPNDDISIWRRLILVDDLFVQTEKIILSIPGIDHQRYIRYFPQTRKGLLSAVLDQDSKRFVPFQNALSDVILQSIDFCAARISEAVRELLISSDDLAELELRTTELFNFLSETDIEPALRMMGLDALEILRSSIAEYRIRGVVGLEEAIERSFGKISMYYMRAKPPKGSSSAAHIGKILDLIVKFETAVAKAHVFIPALAEFLPKLLGPLSP